MQLIQSSTLKPVTSKDVQVLIRQFRMALTNFRIYDAGHAQRASVHRGIWDFLLEVHEDIGPVLVEVVPWGLLINGKGLESEDKGARIVTTWFQERAVSNFFFDGLGRLEDLGAQLDVLSELSVDQIARLRSGAAVDGLGGPPLFFNVEVDSSAVAEDQTSSTQESRPKAEDTGLSRRTTKTDALLPGDGAADAEGAEPAPEAGGWADRLSHLSSGGTEGGQASEKAEGAEDASPSAEEQEASAVAALLERGAEAVCEALSVPLPSDETEGRMRRTLLAELNDTADSELRTQVLGQLSLQIVADVSDPLGTSLLQACEELVPATIDDGNLNTVASFIEQLDLLNDASSALQGRAEAAQVYMSSPALIEKMVRKMEVLPRDQCDLIRKILRGFGHSAMPQLFSLMMTQERKSVRLSLAEVMHHHLRGAENSADLDELTAPLLRELGRDSNAWYVKRNVVYILSSVQTPVCQRALLRLAGQDEDPRVLTEVARSLAQTDSDVAQTILGKLAADPRFSDAAGLFEVVCTLYGKDPQRVLSGLEERLSGKEVASAVAEGSLLGLAWVAEESSLPFFRRLLTEQKGGFRKRALWADSVRSAAIEAIATIRGKEARAVLELGRDDKVSEIRRLAVEFMHMEPSRASVAAYRRIGVSPREEDR